MAVTQRSWALGGAAGAVLILGAGWVFGVSPALSHNSAVSDQVQQAQDGNTALMTKINRLKAQDSQLPALAGQLAAARTELPTTNSLAEFSRELGALATGHGLAITGFSPSTPVAANSRGASTATVGTSAVGSLYQIQATATLTGTAAQEVAFLASLQKAGSRAVLVNTAGITFASDKGPEIGTLTVGFTIFLAPQSAAQEDLLHKQIAVATK